MDKKEFSKLMKMIKGAYGERFQELSTCVLDAWYAGLGDLKADILEKAVEQYIRESKFPPTIAELREMYFEIRNLEAEAERSADL